MSLSSALYGQSEIVIGVVELFVSITAKKAKFVTLDPTFDKNTLFCIKSNFLIAVLGSFYYLLTVTDEVASLSCPAL